MATSIQAGQLGHYTWIIDEIMLEEVTTNQTSVSTYARPFEDFPNNHGIPIDSVRSVDVNDLVTLIGSFFESTFVPVKDIPLSAKGQKGRTSSDNIKKILDKSNAVFQTLYVQTPNIDQPDNF